MPVIGTAGHVDHGKSTLVGALTGIDPDRLEEERRRGMTIDLGFAHLDLPFAGPTGIVDVPGHARFLHNMLAGVHGMDVVLLVVAADEGVMPQTREHLDIVQLLGVTSVVVALTKADLVDGELLELATADAHAEIAGRGIEALIVPVSAVTGRGLQDLVAVLDQAIGGATPPDRGLPRLPIDRSFVMGGFGTVVTGTLVDGALSVGQRLELLPSGGRARVVRVRGLQQHGRPVSSAAPGSRVAVNLQGITHDRVARGQVLAPPGSLGVTTRFDARVSELAGASGLRHDSRVRVYAGTAEAPARLIRLDAEWAQLRLAAPLALRDGDRFVLRRLSPAETLGGGLVVDAAAPLHRRGDLAVVAALGARGDARSRALQEVRRAPHGVSASTLASALALAPEDTARTAAELVAAGDALQLGDLLFGSDVWAVLTARVKTILGAFHGAQPLRRGMVAQELRNRLSLRGRAGDLVLERLATDGLVAVHGDGLVSLPGWEPVLSPAQARLASHVLARLAVEPLAPPRASELAGGNTDLAEVCALLEERGELVRVAPDLWVLPAAVDTAAETLAAHLRRHGSVTVAEARNLLGSSRKLVVPLLEHFDAAHLTVRDGDVRRLRDRAAQ